MKRLEPPDTHFLKAATGWLGLGVAKEAKQELAQISAEQQGHPDVLEVRWRIAADEKDWDGALKIAQKLQVGAPERPEGWLHHAYALRRASGGGLGKAWDALNPAAEKFPREPIIPFNLACYACQMGRLEEARVWLKRAVEIGGKQTMKKMALNDPDLKPLWDEICQL